MPSIEDKNLRDVPIVVLDTETTGLYPGLGHRVVEVGAIRFENWKPVGTFSQLVQPDWPMHPAASKVVGLTDEDLVGKPRFPEIADQLLDFVEGAIMVAHSAPFDAEFLALEFSLAKKVRGDGEHVLPNPWICTLQLARRNFYFGRNNLSHIANKLRIPVGRAHRALNDVYMTAEVLKRMSQELAKRNIKTVGDFFNAQGDEIYAPPPPNIDLMPPMDVAVAEKRDLEILYVHNEKTVRRISPRYAVSHHGTPYLVAYCHLRQAPRVFRIDRIFSATLL
ncbi:MAG: exonuclease domain-containing protein [Candidatus Promineifilaceae bacterium]